MLRLVEGCFIDLTSDASSLSEVVGYFDTRLKLTQNDLRFLESSLYRYMETCLASVSRALSVFCAKSLGARYGRSTRFVQTTITSTQA